MRPFLYLLQLLLCLFLATAAPGVTAPAQAQEDSYVSGEEMSADEEDEEEGESAEAEPPNEDASAATAAPGRRNAYGVVLRPDTYALEDRPVRSPKTPHPLQLANPDHEVVVCEAGCGDSRGTIVYMQRKPLPKAR